MMRAYMLQVRSETASRAYLTKQSTACLHLAVISLVTASRARENLYASRALEKSRVCRTNFGVFENIARGAVSCKSFIVPV
jgi:hypothetical protein